jgi:hypothetical protein
MTRKPAFQASPTNPNIQEIQTEPERRVDMPYAPAMRVESPCGLLFISGATPSPLYHKHPHVISEHDQGNEIPDRHPRPGRDGRRAQGIFRIVDAGQHDDLHQSTLDAWRSYRTRHDCGIPAGEMSGVAGFSAVAEALPIPTTF